MSFASLEFADSLVVHLRRTSFRLSLGLETQISVVFSQVLLPVFFFFFLEVIRSELSLLLGQLLFGFCGRFGFPVACKLGSVNHVFVTEFEVMAVLPVVVGAALDVVDLGGVGNPGALVVDVLVHVLAVECVGPRLPGALVHGQAVDALHVDRPAVAVHVAVFLPDVRRVAVNVELAVQLPDFGLAVFLGRNRLVDPLEERRGQCLFEFIRCLCLGGYCRCF